MRYSPRYHVYAVAHGRTPEEMLSYDKERFPGHFMHGYMLWLAERKEEFYNKHPEAFCDYRSIHDYEAWDKFLLQYLSTLEETLK